MNAKISVFVICVEAIIYLLLNNLHDFTFNSYTRTYFQSENYLPNLKIFSELILILW